jgi:flagellar biosynthesis/type III secretory pathway M-ring protein FliF/YscJ
MEKLIQKVRSFTFTLIILSVLSLTWIAVDYFVLRSIFEENNLTLDLNWILVLISAVPVLLLIIVVFMMAPFVWRLRSKYRSTLKKYEKEKANEIKQQLEAATKPKEIENE